MADAAVIERVFDSLRSAALKVGRPLQSIVLVAVSKTRSLDEMCAYAEVAQRHGIAVVFGENYIQEIKAKRSELPPGSELHMIGPLQSNKIRDAVQCCDLIESVHSLKTLTLVAKEAAKIGKRQRIMLQVNIGCDPNKSGFAPIELHQALDICSQSSHDLQVEGLMTILPYSEFPEDSREHFQALNKLKRDLISQGFSSVFHNGVIALSMGMSADFEIAIEEGADVVRIGTALFGERG